MHMHCTVTGIVAFLTEFVNSNAYTLALQTRGLPAYFFTIHMHGKLWIGKSHVHVVHQIIQARILLKAQGGGISHLSINLPTI